MLQIGKLYKTHTDGQCRLCADITLNGKGATLWFGVEEEQESYLCADRSDAFVMAMLPAAMRGGHEILCQTPMSERLRYQLLNYLVPTLCDAGDLYHPIRITAPLTTERVPNLGGVGTGFSGGVDSLYSIMSHGEDSCYPVTHLAVFNHGVFEGTDPRKAFRNTCQAAELVAAELGLNVVGLDSNLSQVLPERYLDVYTFRNLTCAFALQGLFSVYLLSSGHDVANFSMDLHNCSTFDLLTIHCAQTETLAVHQSGCQLPRYKKLEQLSNWEIAHRWVHPCFHTGVGNKNCGRCHKCTRDLLTLYALGTLDRFGAVFDVPAFKKTLPQRIGMLMANQGTDLYDGVLSLLKEKNVQIPPAAYVYAEQFRKALKNQEGKQP